MTLHIYSIAELLTAAKTLVRAIPGVGTEVGTDHDVTLNAAARLFQVGQVAGKYVYEQLVPATADADNRDRMIDTLGLVFEKAAAPARGMMAICTGDSSAFSVPAGTVITIAGSNFADRLERAYRTLEDASALGFDGTSSPFADGTNIFKLRLKAPGGVSFLHDRSFVRVTTDAITEQWLNAVRRVNVDDHSVDLYMPVKGVTTLSNDVTEFVELIADNVVVPVECTTAGAAGNAPPCVASVELEGMNSPYVVLLETGGGGDAVGPVDGDTERVIRMIEDTIACPPGLGNAQHWREIALACPDVDLDDAIVYQHVRGPGTIDIVCIGRSGGVRSTTYPSANIGFTAWGNNTRRIGEVQAAKVQAWCKAKASYFDDIKVRSVEWDYLGMTFGEPGSRASFRYAGRVDLAIEAQDGYGPDCGVNLKIIPHTAHATNLYPSSVGQTIDDALEPGHRVWVTACNSRTIGAHPFAMVVTEVLSIAADRSYATVASLASLAPAAPSIDGLLIESTFFWGSAGPLTQPAVSAVFDYFDRLGPGSYTMAPKGPGYAAYFGSGVYPPVPGTGVTRWPPEGRRWDSGLRSSELRAKILEIAGVHDVTINSGFNLADFDPAVFMTLALNGVIPAYG